MKIKRSKLILLVALGVIVLGGAAYWLWGPATGGAVHWHADFRVFKCGAELDLADPQGFSNEVGLPTVHEHNDKRIHIEGALASPDDASLGSFFKAVGGSLKSGEFRMPTNAGLVSMKNGDRCPDGKTGTVQVFVWGMENDLARQKKLANPAAYIIKPEALVPAGDCVIVEFGPSTARTAKICESYAAAERAGKIFIEKR